MTPLGSVPSRTPARTDPVDHHPQSSLSGPQRPVAPSGPRASDRPDDPHGPEEPDGPDDPHEPDGPDGPHGPEDPDGLPDDYPEDPDDLAGFQTTMSRVFGRLRLVLGVLVVLAMLIPAGGWVLDRLAVRSAGGAVQEALGEDADITDSLLLVRSVDCAGRSRSGSAFSLDLDGVDVVVTNRHVVDAARSTVVQPLDAGPGAQVREVLLSATADVAVLVLDDGAVPPTLPTGPAATLGQPILTVGFPGARPALREGRVDRVEPGRLLLALEVGAGASGSPVLDEEARVVGQVFARTQDGRGVATPIADVVAAVEDAAPATPCS